MVTKEDIKNLALLARIEITPAEIDSLTTEVDSILDYVGQIKSATVDMERTTPKLRNVLREDNTTNTPLEYKEKLLNNAPSKEGDYLKVKKIL